MNTSGPCFLLTDFGDRDAYVGVMKAVMLKHAPSLQIVDLCHAIEPQNIVSASYVLWSVAAHLPEGSFVVAVVDPGVGTKRRIVALEFAQWTLLAPDNGIASLVLDHMQCQRSWEIRWEEICPQPPSATFHGRDIFAPAAALLASKQRTLEQIGRPIDPASLVRIDLAPVETASGIVARILHVDRFGNLVTNVEAARWNIPGSQHWICCVGDEQLPLVRTYADRAPGEPLAYIGSSGFVEIAVCNGSAAKRYGNAPSVMLQTTKPTTA
jgi:S-adenosylmethionine hydrolase